MNVDSGLRVLRAQNLRCLESVEIEAHPARNVIVGVNGAGKTSILEAIYVLGRGKSFRGGTLSTLIRSGTSGFTVFGEAGDSDGRHRIGIQGSRGGIEARCDGRSGVTMADLAKVLPVQVIDPQVHELIQGGPSGRRRFIDWGVFHVKHGFLEAWRRYRRALQQRNAGLRQGLSRSVISVWDHELIESGLVIDAARRSYVETDLTLSSSICDDMMTKDVKCSYLSGWSSEESFAEALAGSWERDRSLRSTQVGPHRGELAIRSDGEAARHRLSRGQQKMLSIALVLAQSIVVSRAINRRVTLLVDEPAAELDDAHLRRLLEMLRRDELQLFVTALDAAALPLEPSSRVFHVEHGEVSTLV